MCVLSASELSGFSRIRFNLSLLWLTIQSKMLISRVSFAKGLHFQVSAGFSEFVPFSFIRFSLSPVRITTWSKNVNVYS